MDNQSSVIILSSESDHDEDSTFVQNASSTNENGVDFISRMFGTSVNEASNDLDSDQTTEDMDDQIELHWSEPSDEETESEENRYEPQDLGDDSAVSENIEENVQFESDSERNASTDIDYQPNESSDLKEDEDTVSDENLQLDPESGSTYGFTIINVSMLLFNKKYELRINENFKYIGEWIYFMGLFQWINGLSHR